MAESQDGALVGQPVIPAAQAGEVAEQGHVVQRLFHGRVAQREPLLHEVDAQQGLHRERRTAAFAFGHERRDLRHQVGPRHHPVHLVEELPAARALRRRSQSRLLCFMGSMVSGNQASAKHMSGGFCRPSLAAFD